MTWIRPEFEFVDLCSEVTSYLYHRQESEAGVASGACPRLRPASLAT